MCLGRGEGLAVWQNSVLDDQKLACLLLLIKNHCIRIANTHLSSLPALESPRY